MEEFEISISSLKKLKHTITLQPSVDKIKTTYSQTHSPERQYQDIQYYSKSEIDAKNDLLAHKISACETSIKSFNDTLDKTIDDKIKYNIQSLQVWILITFLTVILALVGLIT